MSILASGTVIDGRYRIGPVLGAGGFGVVYRAADAEAGTDVALKTLRPEAIDNEDLVRRFRREARICGELAHPNTARLLGSGRIPAGPVGKAQPYMVFDLVRGLPLSGLVEQRESLGLEETVAVLCQVLASLGDAHARGILHRDLKPNNVLVVAPEATWVTPGGGETLAGRLGIPAADHAVWSDLAPLVVKVVDFGLGKMLELGARTVTRLTGPGVAAGTAEYMSPEQAEGVLDIDLRSDLYGVGMLIFRLLTGRPAYEGASPVEVALMQVTDPLPPLPAPWSGHPIDAVYRRGCAKKRAARYASADEMAAALRAALAPAAPPEAPRGFLARLFRRG